MSSLPRIPLSVPHVSPRALENVKRCFEENWFSQGPFNKELEEGFAKRMGLPHASTCSNGTAALWLALKALGIGPGDEVIVPTFTFSATAAAVVAVGATPVFVDSRPEDGNMSPESVEAMITPKTKAIIPVDIYGIAAPYRELIALAAAHGLKVVEDAAEALGGSYDGKPLGAFGDVGCFSFYPNKTMTTGEGGMCVTASAEIAEKIYLYKNHGTLAHQAYFPAVSGFNMRMTNLQAAVGAAEHAELDSHLEARFKVFETYMELLKDVPGIESLPFKDRTYGPWMFTVHVRGKKKETIVEALDAQGIDSRPGFYPLHLTPAFEPYARGRSFPVSEAFAEDLVNLPTFVGLPKEDISRVVETLSAIARA